MPPVKDPIDNTEETAPEAFSDPARRPWVGPGFALLLAGLLPVWPIEGWWWGVPGWAVFAVMMSLATSAFTVFVLIKAWRDPGESGEDDDGR